MTLCNDVGKVSEYNNWLRAGDSGADFIIDLAAHPLLSDATNTTYFLGDGIHANNAGQTVIAGVFAGAIPMLRTTSVVVTVGGRVMTADGRGIVNVRLSLTDIQGNVRTTTTNESGLYKFLEVSAGDNYIVTAADKRFSFEQPSQVMNVNDDVTDVNFVGNPTSKLRVR